MYGIEQETTLEALLERCDVRCLLPPSNNSHNVEMMRFSPVYSLLNFSICMHIVGDLLEAAMLVHIAIIDAHHVKGLLHV